MRAVAHHRLRCAAAGACACVPTKQPHARGSVCAYAHMQVRWRMIDWACVSWTCAVQAEKRAGICEEAHGKARMG